MLAAVLNSKRYALLALVARGKALNAGFVLAAMPNASMGYAVVSYAPGTDGKVLEQQVRQILMEVGENGVDAGLVEAAKRKAIAATALRRNSIQGLASAWAEAVAVYGLDSPDEIVRRIEKVTPEDVQRVAATYFDFKHALTAELVPHGSGRPVPGRVGNLGSLGTETIKLQASGKTELPDWAKPIITDLEVPSLTSSPIVSTLPNGITLIVQPETVSNTVGVFGSIRHQPKVEQPKGKEGVAALLQALFPFGTENLNRIEFQKELDAIGTSVDAGFAFGTRALAKHFDRAVELLADNELHPALPQTMFLAFRGQFARITDAQKKSPGYLSFRTQREALLPSDDPMLRDATAESIRNVTLKDVRDYYEYAVRPDLTTIVVIGDVTPQHAADVIGKYFGDWKASGPAPATSCPAVPDNSAGVFSVPDSTRVQDSVQLAEITSLTPKAPDFAAFTLANAVLGEGFYTSRLSVALRKETGLVYS